MSDSPRVPSYKFKTLLERTESDSLRLVRTSSSSQNSQGLSFESNNLRKDQGNLLLVALLENYCMLYDQNNERNQKLFLVLCQHLCRMGIIDSSDFVEEFKSVRSSYKSAFKKLVDIALRTVDSEIKFGSLTSLEHEAISDVSSPTVMDNQSQAELLIPRLNDITSLFEEDTSRFRQEFQVLDVVGRGGFGRVLHTKNSLDGCHYAVKMIRTPSTKTGNSLIKTFREVKLLAKLSHVNVVRYFSSWLEHIMLVDDDDSGSDDEYNVTGKPPLQMPRSFSFKEKMVAKDLSTASVNTIPAEGKPKDLVLFIQMELCESTLQEWLHQLNEFQTDKFRRIEEKILYCFTDILNGVAFIHQNGYIHRDLKPTNIYWKPDQEASKPNVNLGGQNY